MPKITLNIKLSKNLQKIFFTGVLFLLLAQTAFAQQITVSGKVTSGASLYSFHFDFSQRKFMNNADTMLKS